MAGALDSEDPQPSHLRLRQEAWDPAPTPGRARSVRASALTLGDEVELLHDIHERVPPIVAIGMARELEPYRLFFLEDPFAPEDNGYFPLLRQQTVDPDRDGRAVRQRQGVPAADRRIA